MRKILFILVLFVTLFSFIDVRAEEITEEITEENIYLIRDKVLEVCTECTKENYPYFIIFENSMRRKHLLISNNFWTHYYTSKNFLKINGNFKLHRYDSDGSFTLINTTFDQDFKTIYYSNYDILSDDGSVFFAKNYPLEEDIEPEPSPSPSPSSSPSPSPSPEPTDTPEVDISELEKCDSFVCDISDSILDDFNDEQFPFVKTIIRFLLLLLVIFVIISPFWLLYKAVRWLM